MKRVAAYFAALCCAFTLTGCAELPGLVGNEPEAAPSAEQIVTDPPTEAPTEASRPADGILSPEDVPKAMTDAGDSEEVAYARFAPVLGNRFTYFTKNLTGYEQFMFLLDVQSGFEEMKEALEESYQKAYSTCNRTGRSNFRPDNYYPYVVGYDPVSAVLYSHRDMEVNPVELLGKMLDGTDYTFANTVTDREWYSFDVNMDIYDLRLADFPFREDYTQRTFLNLYISNATGIPVDEIQVGYSEEENLYYCYIIGPGYMSGGALNLEVTALYFEFDENDYQRVKRAGVETYVRTTDAMNEKLYEMYSDLDRDYDIYLTKNFRHYYEAEPGDDDNREVRDGHVDSIVRSGVPTSHRELMLLGTRLCKNMDPETELTMSNKVQYDLTVEHYNRVERSYFVTGAHYITWISNA